MEVAVGAELWQGQVLELHTQEAEVYHTEIVKKDGRDLYIQNPVNRSGMYMSVRNGMPVAVYFHDDRNGLCFFEASVRLHAGAVSIGVPPEDSIYKAQRRRYFRVPAEVDIDLEPDNAEDPGKVGALKLKTRDLSGGGLSFLYPNEIATGMLVKGTLHLKTSRYRNTIGFHGQIVNCMKQEDRWYRVSVEFLNMKESVRSEVIRFCLTKQIELRNKLRNFQA
jgi:c-di-GMP-binding flagellar brake protein YcgR